MHTADGFILLTAAQTYKLVVRVASVVVAVGLLGGNLLLVPEAAGGGVEVVVHPVSGVVLRVAGQAYQLVVLLSVELLVTPPARVEILLNEPHLT